MTINGANTLAIGQRGLNNSQSMAVNAASKIASAATKPVSEPGTDVELTGVIEPAIALKESQNLFNASARVVEVGKQTIGTMLDVTA